MKNLFTLIVIVMLTTFQSKAQNPSPALIGYWQNWNDVNSPYIPLDQIDSRYNIIDVAFAVPQSGTDYQMRFIPDQGTVSSFISKIQTLQSQGKKVIISIGGATAPISLNNFAERDSFISSMNQIINTYGFDGIDIDFEGSSILVTGGTISSPTDPIIINLIYAIKHIMNDYYTANNKRLLLTMAPETAFVQGGLSAFGGIWGAYLPIIDALRDSIEILHVQLYNSGSMFGVDGNVYTQGTADFIIAMTEAVIQGFNTTIGTFYGLPASKIAIGLPACTNAAGGGFADTAIVQSTVKYLRGVGPKPGSYNLVQSGGYPTLRGLMTWSINWDAVNSCATTYQYAVNYSNLFNVTSSLSDFEIENAAFKVSPNPTKNEINFSLKNFNEKIDVKIFNSIGIIVLSFSITQENPTIDISNLANGLYFIKFKNRFDTFIKEN